MAASWVLKFPTSNENQGHVLIQVSRKDGQPDLDLTLLGTESEAVYKTKLRQKKINGLRSSKYTGSDDEWGDILRHVFLLKQEPAISAELGKGLEAVAAVTGKDDRRVLTITLRNRIDQITQKLGSIELNETEDEIQLFDWATSAVDQQRSLQEEVATLRSRSGADRATITALQSQVADLVRAKKEHEEQLISKFTILLNEKKLKIRNQQRVLSAAKVDKRRLAQLKQTLDGTARHTTRRKRRADTEAEANDPEEDDSDEFETMDVDHMPNAVGDARSSRETTPETETESEGDIPAGQPLASTLAAKSQASKAAAPESENPPPPPRKLPFVKKGSIIVGETRMSKRPETAPGSDDETASEDDEL